MNIQNRTIHLMTLAAVTLTSFALTAPVAYAVPIAGVDFENGAVFDISPDDLDLADGISVSPSWTVAGGVSSVQNDQNGGNPTSGGFVAKFNGGTNSVLPATTPSDYATWSITIPNSVVLNLSAISFDMRSGTTSASRWGMFNTSLDGGPSGGTPIWSSDPLPARPNWQHVNVDLSGPLYQGLTDTSVSFYWYVRSTGDDIDTILLYGTVAAPPAPEPSTALLATLGLLGMMIVRRRNRRVS